MDKKQTIRILSVLNASFPRTKDNADDIDKEIQIAVWQKTFPESYDMVLKAVMKYISTNKYRPTPADIREVLYNMTNGHSEMTSADAWLIARKLIQNAGWDMTDCRSKWESLPIEVKEIYKAPDIWELSKLPSEQIEKFERPAFIKSFESNQQKHKQYTINTDMSDLLEIGHDSQKLIK